MKVRFEWTQRSRIIYQVDVGEDITSRKESGKEACVARAEAANLCFRRFALSSVLRID